MARLIPVAEGLARAGWLLAGVALTTLGHAQEAPARDPLLAETLFQSGKELMNAGRAAEACPKLAESHRLDPAGGTVLLLGLCYQEARQWASAWLALNDAMSLARKDGREDREKRARERLTAVEAKLSRLTLRLGPPARAVPGLQLRRDGREIPAAAWDTPLPIDPGPHRLEAQAPGHLAWSTTVTFGEERSDQTVEVPPLALQPVVSAPASASTALSSAPPPASAPAPPAAPGRTTLQNGALAVGAVGVVALGLGTYFGARTLSLSRDANDRCPRVDCSDRQGVDSSNDAARYARLSNLGLGLGAFALTGAVILYVVGRPTEPTASGWRLTPTTALGPGGRPSQANLTLEGRW